MFLLGFTEWQAASEAAQALSKDNAGKSYHCNLTITSRGKSAYISDGPETIHTFETWKDGELVLDMETVHATH